jgi:hypothetical protein
VGGGLAGATGLRTEDKVTRRGRGAPSTSSAARSPWVSRQGVAVGIQGWAQAQMRARVQGACSIARFGATAGLDEHSIHIYVLTTKQLSLCFFREQSRLWLTLHARTLC